jgi:hypothetical protein
MNTTPVETLGLGKPLVLSSFVFLSNVATGIYTEQYWYACLFFWLTLTSMIFHSTNDPYAKCVDQGVIFLIFLYGSYRLSRKSTPENRVQRSVIVGTFLVTVFLYYYGYTTNQYCYSPDKYVSDVYHSALQCVASMGHHMIMFM